MSNASNGSGKKRSIDVRRSRKTPGSKVHLKSLKSIKRDPDDPLVKKELGKTGQTTGRLRKRKTKKSKIELQTKAEEKLKFDVIQKAIFGHWFDLDEKHDLEAIYVGKFSEVSKLTEQKNIKFFSAIGDPYITQAETEAINTERKEFKEQWLDRL